MINNHEPQPITHICHTSTVQLLHQNLHTQISNWINKTLQFYCNTFINLFLNIK